MIEATYTLTKPEYMEAQSLFLKDESRKTRGWRWSLVGIFLLSAAVVAFTQPRPVHWTSIPNYAFVFVIIALVLLFPGLIQRRALHNRYAKERANLTSVSIRIDVRGFHTDIPGQGFGFVEWGAIQKWTEGKSVFMLRSGLLMRIVPKSALSLPDQDAFRRLLNQEIRLEGEQA